MKIAIDGFNLGLREGTGIATYSRNLASALSHLGHEIFPVYGLNRVGRDASLSWARFIQSLTVHGEPASGDFLEWVPNFILRAPKQLIRLSSVAYPVVVAPEVEVGPVKEKLPSYDGLYNCDSVFRTAQAYSSVGGATTKLKFSDGFIPHLFHATCPIPIDLPRTKKIVTVHDVIPLVLPTSTEVNLKHYRRMVAASIKDASAVFAVSEHSKRDFLNFFDFPADRVHVTYQAVDIPERYQSLGENEVRNFVNNNYSLGYKEYFLFYGAIEPKKNILRILEAFSIADCSMPIVIVGKDGWLYEDVKKFLNVVKRRKLGRRKFVRIPYAPFRHLMHLLKGAKGVVFPSIYEGFGLPVLEAMVMGVPVITSTSSSLPEVGGDAAHYVDAYDNRSIADGIERIAHDDSYADELVRRGYKQAQHFSMHAYEERLHMGYSKALNT
jgi:glycosyltransferase involved in cell wall biosynthesis